MKTAKIKIESYKDTSLMEVAFELFRKKEMTDEDDEVIYEKGSKIFEYGEYLDMEVEVDEDLNIIRGKIIPFKKDWNS